MVLREMRVAVDGEYGYHQLRDIFENSFSMGYMEGSVSIQIDFRRLEPVWNPY